MSATVRVRSVAWFATGVALTVATTVLVMSAWRADAAPGADETTFVPIAPCRLFDYRPSSGVGARSTPLGPAETVVQQITGAVGACNIPSTASGVAMNVTVTEPTADSNLRIFPADVAVPNASNLNWAAGQQATPNKVDVKLSPTGAIGIYNAFGHVYVLADATGYYTRTGLTDLQNQIQGLQSIVAAQGAQIATLDASQPFTAHVEGYQTQALAVNGAPTVIRTLTVKAPVAGTFLFAASAWTVQDSSHFIGCAIRPNIALYQDDPEIQRTQGSINGPISMALAINVTAGQTLTRHLVCANIGSAASNAGTIKHSTMNAIFTPAP